jgi:hypothetical protein
MMGTPQAEHAAFMPPASCSGIFQGDNVDCRPSACRTWGRLSLPPIFLAALACLLACPTLLFWPVDALTIRDAAGRSVLDAPLPLGRAVETEYTDRKSVV